MQIENQTLKNLHVRNWKPVSRHEPVGCVVFILCASGEILKGYRKEPTCKKYQANNYYCVRDGSVINHPLYWDYI